MVTRTRHNITFIGTFLVLLGCTLICIEEGGKAFDRGDSGLYP
jgi:hypothetical protein